MREPTGRYRIGLFQKIATGTLNPPAITEKSNEAGRIRVPTLKPEH
jgi:hypothetical protein